MAKAPRNQKKNNYPRKGSAQTRVSNIPTNQGKPKDVNKVSGGTFVYSGALSIGDLAKKLNIVSSDIIKFLFLQGKMMTINTILDDDTIGLICLQFGFDFKKEKVVEEQNFEEAEFNDDPAHLKERPPVVTVMGHVDHGKTTLIDAIRSSNVVATEVGGISQAIGAYQKEIQGKKITFIDTPGHEAFTAMRSRGASVTDIVVLVVAADDGVMPQTKEAIDHAKAAGVPIVVAVNKIDKPGADPDKVINELMAYDIIPEKYGGNNIFVNISAKKNLNIDKLLEAIITLSEMLELKANPSRYAMGTVLEAKLDKGEGPKATLLVQNGTLNSADYVVVGAAYGKIRRMTNENQKVMKIASPSTPVAVIGLSEVPQAGDHFMAFPTEKQAREIALKRKLAKEEKERGVNSGMSLDDLYNRIHEGETQDLNLIIKADNSGSAEAVKASVEKLSNDKVKINVIRSTAGAITESDVLLASASNAIIYGFNVRPNSLVRKKAEEEHVEIRLQQIIYALIEEIEEAMKGMYKTEYVEKILGQAEIRHIFKITGIGTVGGSYVVDGTLKNHAKIRLIREGVVVHEGELGSLQREKEQVKEVNQGYECGLTIKGYNDIKVGDIVEDYEMTEKK